MTYQHPKRQDATTRAAMQWYRSLPESKRLEVIRLAGRSQRCIVGYWVRGGR